MECSEYLEIMSDEVDGELVESSSLTLMRHLVQCDGCRSEYSQLLSLSEIVNASSPQFPLEIPSHFTANVMALIEKESISIQEVSPNVEVKRDVFGELFHRIKEISFPSPSLSWSFSASLILVVALTFFYRGNDSGLSPQQMMTDAKVIKARVLKRTNVTASANAGNDLNYYVKKHVSALRSKPANTSMRYAGAVVSYASYESGALRNK